MLDQTAVILSGGVSSRMNYNNKAFLEMDGKRLIEIIADQLSCFKEILIVSNQPEEYQYLNLPVITDIIPRRGPMSGIHAGLVQASFDCCFVLPCDMPFIPKGLPEFLSELSPGYDVTVPVINGRYQPLCGVYRKNCIVPIEHCLSSGWNKIAQLFPMVKVREVKEEDLASFGNTEAIFRNINRPEDYIKYCKEGGSAMWHLR